LNSIYDGKAIIYADDYGMIRLQSGTFIYKGLINDLSPNVMDQHAYVYSTYANVIKNIARRAFNGKFLAYLFPRMFLENNKNVVYSNGESEVYK
jgi:hypothetical protein